MDKGGDKFFLFYLNKSKPNSCKNREMRLLKLRLSQFTQFNVNGGKSLLCFVENSGFLPQPLPTKCFPRCYIIPFTMSHRALISQQHSSPVHGNSPSQVSDLPLHGPTPPPSVVWSGKSNAATVPTGSPKIVKAEHVLLWGSRGFILDCYSYDTPSQEP